MKTIIARFSLILLAWIAFCTSAFAAEASATLQWARRVELSFAVSGVVKEVFVTIGEHVAAGAKLAALDARGLQARVNELRAHVDRVTPELEEAQRELERAKDLYDRTVLSDHELTLAQVNFARLDAQRRMHRAALVQAQLDVESSVMRAPFDGLVIARPMEAGQTVVTRCQSVPLLTMADPERFIARALLPAERLDNLEQDQTIDVVINARRMTGVVRSIAYEPSTVEADEPRYALDVAVHTESGATFRVGQKATLDIPDS